MSLLRFCRRHHHHKQRKFEGKLMTFEWLLSCCSRYPNFLKMAYYLKISRVPRQSIGKSNNCLAASHGMLTATDPLLFLKSVSVVVYYIAHVQIVERVKS